MATIILTSNIAIKALEALNGGRLFGSQGSPPPPVDQRFANELISLITNAGFTLNELATAIAVSPVFLQRVVDKRQPLPVDVARSIAAAIGVDAGTVLGAAGYVTTNTGPIYRVAVPPNPLLGDVVSGAGLGTTQPVNAPVSSTVAAWVVGAGVGGGGLAGAAVVDRAFGLRVAIPLAHTAAPIAVAFGPSGDVWTVGTDGYATTLALEPPALVLEASVASNTGGMFAYEAASNAIWVGVTGGLLSIASNNPVSSALMAINVLGSSAHGFGVLELGGKLYVCAQTAVVGRRALLEILPVSRTINRSSHTSTGMIAPFDVAFDGVGFFLVTDGQIIYSVDLASFAAVQVANDASLNAATYVTYGAGSFWVSDTDDDGFPRIVRFKLTAAGNADVIADYKIGTTLQAAGAGCRVVFDLDGFVWATNPSEGKVLILDATQTSGDPTVQAYSVGGSPTGIAIL